METWTKINGRRIRSLTMGVRTELPKVVLVPGMGAPLTLVPWARRIGRWTRATVLDLPGWHHGRSRASSSTVAAVGAATVRWLEVTDSRSVVLAGHSSGSQSALHSALLVPDRLLRLALSAPTLDPQARHLAVLLLRLLQTVTQEKPSEIPTALPCYHSGGLPWLRLAGSVIRDRSEYLLAGLPLPVLLMSGDRDRFAPPAWMEHLATLGTARRVVLPGSHNVCFTSPEAADVALHQSILAWTAQASKRSAVTDKTARQP